MAASVSSLLDPTAISRGKTLGLLAQRVIRGYRAGEHRSSLLGFGVEFSQHREYAVGDDMRHIDWKVYGKKDRYYIKQHQLETCLTVHLVVDGSESMTFGSGRCTKLDYAKTFAASLAWLVLLQRDGVSLNIFDTEIRWQFPRIDSLNRIFEIMDPLAAWVGKGGTDLAISLGKLADGIRNRGIVVVLSDLLDDEDNALRSLQALRFAGHEVIVFQVLDEQELHFSFDGRVEFIGLEEEARIETSPEVFRESYLRQMNALRDKLRQGCEHAGAHYVLANTAVPLSDTLGRYLAFRRQLVRR